MEEDAKSSKYAIEFVDSSTQDDAMYDCFNVLCIDGKVAVSIATCWDPSVADRILAGFEMLDMLDSGIVPGVPARQLNARTDKKKTPAK